jgi:hypothetical protein
MSLDKRHHPILGLEKDIIDYLPVWGPGIPLDVNKLWTNGILDDHSIIPLNPVAARYPPWANRAPYTPK